MKTCLKDSETQKAVDRVKANISPKIPCVNADADGYCTRNGGGFICFKCTDYKPVTAVTVADGSATMPAIALEQAQGATAAECVKFDLGMANRHGALSLAYLARAGWRLSHQKAEIGRGGWKSWCRETVGISEDTANRYIQFYNKTVTRWRESQGLANAMVAELTDKMIAAATADIDANTATGAMIELGIVKRPPGWGGAREGAGRKDAAAAAAAGYGLDMGDSATLMWMEAMKPFEANRAAFHSAARDLNPNVAARFLEELRMLERTLDERVKGAR